MAGLGSILNAQASGTISFCINRLPRNGEQMSNPPAHRLILLDGMALVYRAHFAFMVRPIINSSGANVSAVFGFANTLIDLIKTQSPTHLAVVFDTAAPTARHTAFPAYKAQRESMPEELSLALPSVKRLIEVFNIPVLSMDGYEADDIIGTLARQAGERGDFETFMVTPDKDFAQLVDSKTFIYKPGRLGAEHEIIDTAKVREQWLVERPEQVIDVLALWGDASDNIPGVPGIGEKTAKALIQKFGSVEAIIAGAEELKGKQRENVLANIDQLKVSKQLTTIDLQVPISVDLDALKMRSIDEPAAREFLIEMEFNQLGRRLFGASFRAGRGFIAKTADAPVPEVPDLKPSAQLKKLHDTPHQFDVISATELPACPPPAFAFALDTDGTDPRTSRVQGVAFAWEAGKAVYVGCRDGIPDVIKTWFTTSETLRIGHDLKPYLTTLLWHNISVTGIWHDLYLAQLLTDPDQKATLEFLTEALLGYTPMNMESERNPGDLLGLETDEESSHRLQRAMERAECCVRLHSLLMARVEATGQTRVFHQIEMPLLPVLAIMEHSGIKIDTEALAQLGVLLQTQITQLEASIQKLAGQRFNLNSPRQLGQILFDHLRLAAKPRKTKTGQYVTNEEVLQELISLHPIVAQLLEYREATKLKSTYVDALPQVVSPRSGRIHTTYLQLSTATGRLASNHPNLQNIPIRTDQGREIRRGFVAEGTEWQLLAADYNQIELRVMAHLSGDTAMQEAFSQGEDIHTATAARVFGVMPALVTSEMRRTAKMVNFGIIYGISAFGLAQRLDQSRTECQRLIDEYFVQYPGVKMFMDRTITEAAANGYVETLSGRRRYLRDIRSANATVRKAAERTAINTPIQGTAADMIKLAMIHIQKKIHAENLKARMLLQVHDELVFEAPDQELSQLRLLAEKAMQEALPLCVPIKVDFGSGSNWKLAHP